VKQTAFHIASAQLDTYIREHAMRPSPVRMIVLEQACQLPQPFTAAQLVQACQSERISTGTIYNALDLFVSAQILHAIQRQRGRKAIEFELMVGTTVRMQVICHKCGRVSDFRDKALERLIAERKYSNFIPQEYSLYVYGECKVCKTYKKKKTNTI